jgi:hypothetical protein
MSTSLPVATFDEYLNNLIDKKFPNNPPQAFKDQVKSDLYPLLIQSVNLAQIDALTPTLHIECKQLFDSNASPETIQQFLEKNLPNQQLVIARALVDFHNKYLNQNSAA